jgi:hypothetical protein
MYNSIICKNRYLVSVNIFNQRYKFSLLVLVMLIGEISTENLHRGGLDVKWDEVSWGHSSLGSSKCSFNYIFSPDLRTHLVNNLQQTTH